ncbi:MAG: FliH/SctL family protein, partial [Myxococcota bacterium]
PPAPSPSESAAVAAVAEAESRLWAERAVRAVEALRMHSSRLAEEARADAVEIGFQVAQRILEKEVATDLSALNALVRSALRRVGESREIRVHVSTEDHARLEGALQHMDLGELQVAQVTLLPDAGLKRGDVVVETDFGTIDGRLQTRLDEMRSAVTTALGGRAA